jgi:hypothetical protein
MSSGPVVTSITPASGPPSGGTKVTIAGSGLSTATDVQFGGVSTQATLAIASDTSISSYTPGGASLGSVSVTVITPQGNATWPGGFTYAVTYSGIYPVSGTVTGGYQASITGSGLLGVFGVQIGATVASFVVQNDGLISVTIPPAAAPGGANIVLLGLTGETLFTAPGAFIYLPAAASAPSSSTSTSATPNTPVSTTSTPAPTPAPSSPASAGSAPAASGSASPTPASPAPGMTAPAAAPPATLPAPAPAAASSPTAASYYPGGAMTVPGGLTGLGGSAGTGAGFGVGTLIPGGGGSAAPSNLSYYVDPGLTGQLVQTLIGLVQSAASPDAIEAQNIILRRMALEGDVIGSRLPPPRNISEIGGYLNLLDTLKEKAMREQTLAGILGVAGPVQSLGWINNNQPLSLVAVTNDRPAVAAQPSFPLTVLVRSDFVAAVQSALSTLHTYGATLPLTSPSAIVLPPGGTGAAIPPNVMYYLGRTLMIAPTAALANPATDPVAVIAPTGPGMDYALGAQVLNAGSYPVVPADLEAVQCTPAAEQLVPLNEASFVPVGPILASAGFYSSSPFPVPANNTDNSWAWFTNIAGLIPGETELGDELSLLYRQDQIAASAYASMLTWTWNGTTFAP